MNSTRTGIRNYGSRLNLWSDQFQVHVQFITRYSVLFVLLRAKQEGSDQGTGRFVHWLNGKRRDDVKDDCCGTMRQYSKRAIGQRGVPCALKLS